MGLDTDKVRSTASLCFSLSEELINFGMVRENTEDGQRFHERASIYSVLLTVTDEHQQW